MCASVIVFTCVILLISHVTAAKPIVINTWEFTGAANTGWEVLRGGGTAVDAIEAGCGYCEENQQCGSSVGYGGSPSETGETTLDAMIMDGKTHDVGAVGCLRNIKNAIRVARSLLEHTEHTLLVGDLATNFAVSMGFQKSDLSTPDSTKDWENWKNGNCQPNFWCDVVPDPRSNCGPYTPIEGTGCNVIGNNITNHDTIGMIAIDANNNIASGTSTNGLRYKIPGRVGDSPIVGSGSYADNDAGGCAATGDGDIMMRFSPCFYAVELMHTGLDPTRAAEAAIDRIRRHYPNAQAALITVDRNGNYGAACNWNRIQFPFSVVDPVLGSVHVLTVQCQ